MIEQTLDITTKAGAMETFICHPERGGPFPAVFVLMDAPGIREELRDMARRLGTVGYYVLLSNLYHRAGRDTIFGPDVLEQGSVGLCSQVGQCPSRFSRCRVRLRQALLEFQPRRLAQRLRGVKIGLCLCAGLCQLAGGLRVCLGARPRGGGFRLLAGDLTQFFNDGSECGVVLVARERTV